jgi:subtilisin family serine protease
MIRIGGRRRIARFVLTAGIAAAAVVTGTAGDAFAGTPAALPTGTVLDADADGAIAGSYIVVLKPGSAAAGRVTSASQALVREYGGTVISNYIATFRGFHARMTPLAAARLAADPSVSYVEQDAEVSLAATETSSSWGLDRIDQRTRPLSGTYNYRSAAGVTAYVIDTGIRITQQDYAGRAAYGWDFIDNDSVAADCNGHGTHVAGTIGGTRYGVAKDVKLVAVRALDCKGSGSYSAIIAAIDWVTAHAVKPAVANMSVGGPNSAALNNAVTRSIAAGVTYAVAAGNDNLNACGYSPAATPNAITVGATDQVDNRAYFSNFGSCVDIFAPGVQITSDSYQSDTATQTMSGTSMATPHVAGAAALVLGANPAWTPLQVRNALVTQATAAVGSPGAGSPNKLLYTGWVDGVANTKIPATTRSASLACRSFTAGADVAIGRGKTATSSRTVSGCAGLASSTSTVRVRVKDGYRGSLAVTLTAPNGTRHLLKGAQRADHARDLAIDYRVNLRAASRNGTWTLRVTDAYGANSGTLQSWGLRL